jgi:tetratricopeptide (TPR) repeat protein
MLICALATSGFAQEPKWADTKQYEQYMSVFNEKDLPKKAAGAEKFLAENKIADPIIVTQVYQMMLLSYANAGNWAKTLETIERMDIAPKLTDGEKLQYIQIGMVAAQSSNNNPKTIEYAEKVLAADPNNARALITLSSVLAGTMPTTEPQKTPHMNKTLEITKRALAIQRPAGTADKDWNPVQQQLRETTCMILLNQNKHAESITECQAALKINPRDGYAWYLIGMSHKVALIDLSKKYNESVDKYNANRTADQLTIDELRAAMQGAETIASNKRDETVDAFARAVAANGNAKEEAMKELRNIFPGTPDELNKLIEEKKSQLGNGND